MKNTSTAFDQNTLEYDQWFEKNSAVYESEILAIQLTIPQNKKGIEIGVGTGRFAEPFNIKFGVEPSENMAKVSEQKGIIVYRAYAENLPLDNATFDFVLMVTIVCFLSDISKAFSEVYRILKPNGEIILGIIDKNSELGRKYEKEKSSNKFYSDAHFHSTEELTALLQKSRFQNFQYWQTLISLKENEIEKPEKGYGQGSFVVIKAFKV
jgi:ubiquinone/menaquinone biosynthesis C-methylase UbiE